MKPLKPSARNRRHATTAALHLVVVTRQRRRGTVQFPSQRAQKPVDVARRIRTTTAPYASWARFVQLRDGSGSLIGRRVVTNPRLPEYCASTDTGVYISEQYCCPSAGPLIAFSPFEEKPQATCVGTARLAGRRRMLRQAMATANQWPWRERLFIAEPTGRGHASQSRRRGAIAHMRAIFLTSVGAGDQQLTYVL